MRARIVQRRAIGGAPAMAPPVVHRVVNSPGKALGGIAGPDFSHVRVHTDSEAAVSAASVGASAYTVGQHIVFGAGEFSPLSPSGRDLLRHELMHVRQQSSAAALGALEIADSEGPLEREADRMASVLLVQRDTKKPADPLPNTLSGYPEEERNKLVAGPLISKKDAEWISEYFDPEGASYSGESKIQIAPLTAFPTKFQKPLESTAFYLTTHRTAGKLEIGQTISIAIAEMNQVIRFSFLQHGKPPKSVVVVEAVGAMGGSAASAIKDGEAKFKAKKFKFDSSWGNANEKKILYQTLALIPPAAWPDGLTFGRKAEADEKKDDAKKTAEKNTKQPEAGFYDPNTHTIFIRNNAFDDEALNTVGLSANIVAIMAHEIGHAVDRGPIREAEATFKASRATTESETARKNARGLAGGSDFKPEDPKDFGTEFRQAAKQDGIGPDTAAKPRKLRSGGEATLRGSPTDYGDTNWKELFGDTFALYVADPKLLEAIRPHTFAYFAQKFPQPAATRAAPTAPATPAGTGGAKKP